MDGTWFRVPGTAELRHSHRTATQFFYIFQGTLSIEMDGYEHALIVGQGLSVPAGQAHQVFNRSDAAAEFLVVSNPPSHGDRVPADPLS